MSERAHNIIKAIVIDNDWTKLRPLQMARVTQMHKWIYVPDPDFEKDVHEYPQIVKDAGVHFKPIRRNKEIKASDGWSKEFNLALDFETQLRESIEALTKPYTIDYRKLEDIEEMEKEVRICRGKVKNYNQWVDFKNKEFASQIVSTWEPSEDGESGDVDYDKIEGKE